MNPLKEIFKRIEGREWDWFGSSDEYLFEYHITKKNTLAMFWYKDHPDGTLKRKNKEHSLADLLANKSWCQAVWKEKLRISNFDLKAFVKLQEEGEGACINYIIKTMI